MRIALAALVLLVASARADTTAQNLEKYRALRHRLVTDFVSVGPAQGQSQPAPERMDNIGLMKWGDGTIALGFYLGVLATEHYIFSHPTQFPGAAESPADLDATRDELYNALLALERLDLEADAAFPSPCSSTPNLNGFFLRDDVPADFSSHFAAITTIQSDFIDPTLTNKEESQDQVYHVQHGLALVIALVPASVTVQGKSLRAWAVEQATRITKHFTKGDWIIRNPACGNRAVNRGDNASGFSYGETLATAYLTDGAYKPTTSSLFQTIWDTLRQPANPTYNDEDNLHMALAIMAVGDGYGTETPQVIATLAATQDWPLYPLLHRVLHRTSSTGFCTTTAATVNPRARAMLDELPLQSEPACPGPSGPAPHGFTTHNRFIRGKSQAYVGPDGCEGVRYHGLDYMLLHNLYAIATPGTWNGNPDADPCAPPIEEEPDGMPVVDSDAGVDEPDPAVAAPTTGCGCQAPSHGMAWPLFVIASLMLRRRRRR
jgi:uncharacterized protein (TIGR03382 family)